MKDFFKLLGETFTKNVSSTSEGGDLNKIDWAKIVRNTLQVAGSAALSAGVGYLGTTLLAIDWGTVAVFALPVIHFVMEAVTRKFKNNNTLEQ